MAYPAVPWFDELSGGSSEASYELPYPYSRRVETNLDIHHTPFVHGTFGLRRMGPVTDPFEAEIQATPSGRRGSSGAPTTSAACPSVSRR